MQHTLKNNKNIARVLIFAQASTPKHGAKLMEDARRVITCGKVGKTSAQNFELKSFVPRQRTKKALVKFHIAMQNIFFNKNQPCFCQRRLWGHPSSKLDKHNSGLSRTTPPQVRIRIPLRFHIFNILLRIILGFKRTLDSTFVRLKIRWFSQ